MAHRTKPWGSDFGSFFTPDKISSLTQLKELSQRRLCVVMFTDIEGYTEILQSNEDQGRSVFNRNRKITSAVVAKYRGEIIQFFGDGFLVIFKSAYDSVECAREIQKACRGGPILPLRIGLHLGEVVCTEGTIFGNAVNIASRVQSLATSGSVILTERVYIDIANLPDIQIVPFGKYHFKNVQHPLKLFALVDEGIIVPSTISETAKLQTTTIDRNAALPNFNQPFIGRETEVAKLTEIILQNANQIISVVGIGGLGKTRLSVEVAQRAGSHFSDGVAFVALDEIENPELLVPHLGRKIGLKENPEVDWIQLITEKLQEAHFLLILDNFEHVIHAAGLMSSILIQCPKLTVLTTSRTPLNLKNEIIFPLATMPLPELSEVESEGQECMVLFEQKAQAVVPAFKITQDNYQAVADICHKLDGLPLAIELAAARIKMFSAQSLAQRLKDLLKVLRGKIRETPRHQTIFATIEWSYDLLSIEAQNALQIYAVFPSSFSFDAAEKVASEIDNFETVEELVSHSLLQKRDTADGSEQYLMLRVVREFGLHKIKERNALRQVELTYALYYCGQWMNKEINDLTENGPESQLSHLRKALNILAENEPLKYADLLEVIWPYFLRSGNLREMYEYLEEAIANPQIDMRGDLHIAAGIFSHNLGLFQNARNRFSQVLEYFIAQQNENKTLETLNHLSWAEIRLGNYTKGKFYADEVIRKCVAENSTSHQTAKAMNNLAWIGQFQGDFVKSAQIHREIIGIYRSSDNQPGLAFALTNLAWCTVMNGQFQVANQAIEEATKIFKSHKHEQMVTFKEAIWSIIQIERGYLAEARQKLTHHCMHHFREMGDSWGLAFVLQKLAEIDHQLADYEGLNNHIFKSLEICRRTDDRWGIAQCHYWIAKYCHQQKDIFEAKRNIEIGLQIALDLEMRLTTALLKLLQAEIYHEEGKRKQSDLTAREVLSFLPTDNSYLRRKLFTNVKFELPADIKLAPQN